MEWLIHLSEYGTSSGFWDHALETKDTAKGFGKSLQTAGSSLKI